MSLHDFISQLSRFKLIDLTMPITNGMPVFPGHQRTVIFPTTTATEMKPFIPDDGVAFNVEGILMSNHESTHVDAPIHVKDDGASVDQLPLARFVTRGVCLDVSATAPEEYITDAVLEEAEKKAGISIQTGDTLLLYTGHHERCYQSSHWFRHTGLDESGSHWVVQKKVFNVGIDAPNIDSSREMRRGVYPAHRILLKEHGILITENLIQLSELINKPFLFIGFPLPLKGASGSPIRAVAFVE